MWRQSFGVRAQFCARFETILVYTAPMGNFLRGQVSVQVVNSSRQASLLIAESMMLYFVRDGTFVFTCKGTRYGGVNSS